MDLTIDINAADKEQAAVVSVTDLTPVTSIPQITLGDSQLFRVFFTDEGAAPSWSGDPTYNLELALGELDTMGLMEYTCQLAFDPIAGGWSGRLNLATQKLIDAIAYQTGAAVNWTRFPQDARLPRARPVLGWFFLQVRVVDPQGNKTTYAQLRQPVLNRVLRGNPVENASYAPVIQQTLVDAANIAWDVGLGPWGKIELGGDHHFLTPTAFLNGQVLVLEVTNPGPFIPTFSSDFIWPLPDSTPPIPLGSKQIYSFACTDGKLYATMLDFA